MYEMNFIIEVDLMYFAIKCNIEFLICTLTLKPVWLLLILARRIIDCGSQILSNFQLLFPLKSHLKRLIAI